MLHFSIYIVCYVKWRFSICLWSLCMVSHACLHHARLTTKHQLFTLRQLRDRPFVSSKARCRGNFIAKLGRPRRGYEKDRGIVWYFLKIAKLVWPHTHTVWVEFFSRESSCWCWSSIKGVQVWGVQMLIRPWQEEQSPCTHTLGNPSCLQILQKGLAVPNVELEVQCRFVQACLGCIIRQCEQLSTFFNKHGNLPMKMLC